jgi:hypothetical protein
MRGLFAPSSLKMTQLMLLLYLTFHLILLILYHQISQLQPCLACFPKSHHNFLDINFKSYPKTHNPLIITNNFWNTKTLNLFTTTNIKFMILVVPIYTITNIRHKRHIISLSLTLSLTEKIERSIISFLLNWKIYIFN